MEKIWLKEYPQGVGYEVNTNAYSSIVEVMEVSCRKFGDKPAFTNMGTNLSFKEVERLSGYFAAYLKHELKLKKGDRVAVMMPNLLQYPIAVFGILRAGLVVVNVNPLYTARELEHQLEDSGARAILVVENFARTLAKIVDKTRVEKVITTQIGDMLPAPKRLLTNLVVKHVKRMVPDWDIADTDGFRTALDKGARFQGEAVTLGQDDIAFLQYTGGTTGLSKGAVLTHGNLVANMQQATAWFARNLDDSGGEIVITALPLYHIFALTVNCLMFFKLGGQNVLITNPRDMEGFVKELGKYDFSVITGVNTLFNGLLNTPGFAELDFSHLKVSVGGGMAVQRPVAEEWKQVTGKPLIEGYGLTETSPMATANRLDLEDYNSSIGVPIPMTEMVIRDDDNNDVPIGEPGELCIRGPQVMKGYWQKPEENAKVFTEDGFLRTGDIARMDDKGYFYIVDRKKDMILVSGFNVFPNEIEEVVTSHPNVLEAACVGVPDEKTGEAVKVFVVKKDETLNKDSVVSHCREHLTGYKVPKHVEFREELPKSNVGKILRKELR